MKPYEQIKQNQIDEQHGSEPILNIPYINTSLTVNKTHAIELALANSFIIAYIYNIQPKLTIPLILEMYLASTGYSILFDKLNLTIPNYAYTYTVRKNPWYYLIIMTIFIPLFILILKYK